MKGEFIGHSFFEWKSLHGFHGVCSTAGRSSGGYNVNGPAIFMLRVCCEIPHPCFHFMRVSRSGNHVSVFWSGVTERRERIYSLLWGGHETIDSCYSMRSLFTMRAGGELGHFQEKRSGQRFQAGHSLLIPALIYSTRRGAIY